MNPKLSSLSVRGDLILDSSCDLQLPVAEALKESLTPECRRNKADQGRFVSMRWAMIAFAIVFACLCVANGALLTFRPNFFLRFYDWQNRGDFVGKTAGWRKDVDNAEYKFLGVMSIVIGLLIIGFIARVVLGK